MVLKEVPVCLGLFSLIAPSLQIVKDRRNNLDI